MVGTVVVVVVGKLGNVGIVNVGVVNDGMEKEGQFGIEGSAVGDESLRTDVASQWNAK